MAGGPYKTNGWYHIIWTQNGQQAKEALKTKSLPEARRRMKKLEAEYFDGIHKPFERKWYERPDQSLSLPEIAEEYIAFKLSQKGRKGWKADHTYTTQASVVRMFATDYHLTSESVSAFLHRDDISDTTRVSYKAKLDAFLKWCVKEGYIDQAPAVEVNLPQQQVREYVRQSKLEQIFSRLDELARIGSDRYESKHAGHVSDTSWYADWCRAAVGTGLRPGELLKIRVDDISDSDIYVGKSFRVKTNFARKVPIDDPFAEVIHKYRDPDFRKSDPVLSRTPFLFGRSRLKELNRDLKQACKVAYSPVTLTAKEFRHLFAMRFLLRKSGDDLKLLRLMQVMGHRQLSTTQNYLSYLPSDGKI